MSPSVQNKKTMDELVDFVQSEFRKMADPVKAPQMQAYMKNRSPFYGINKPERVAVTRQFKKEFRPANQSEWTEAILALWNLQYREEKYAALDYAVQFPQYFEPESLKLYGQLVREGAWWDLVDFVVSQLVSPTLLCHREKVRPTIEQWIDDKSLWIRRTALLSQLKHKDQLDESQLFGHVLMRCEEKEFFIRKAIGWALRDYSWTNPEAIHSFLRQHGSKLSGLSIREASKELIRSGYMKKSAH